MPVPREFGKMIHDFLKKKLSRRTLRRSTLIIVIKVLINTFTVQACAQAAGPAWSLLEAGLTQKSSARRLTAVQNLGRIPNNDHAIELAEKALKDKSSGVRAAAATALGLMHASQADTQLKQALNDKNLAVVMAAAHALRLLNDPACYDVYYAIFTGARKNDEGMIAQEMKILHDPKQLVDMGVSEGIGFVPFAGDSWEAYQTIMKDKKDGAAAKAALVAALAKDPEPRTSKLLLTVSQNHNWVLRVAALQAIAKRGDPVLLPEIEPRLSDSKREVRYAAAATIIRLEDSAKARTTEGATAELPARANDSQSTNAVMPARK
jgi:HEAT repeat protein